MPDLSLLKLLRLWQTAVKKLIVMPRSFFSTEMAARDRVFVAFEKYWKSDYSDAAAVTLARKLMSFVVSRDPDKENKVRQNPISYD